MADRTNKAGQRAAHHDKKTPEVARAFLDSLREVPNVSRAARAAGISYTLAYTWKADEGFLVALDPVEDPVPFGRLWEEALKEGKDQLERVGLEAALGHSREPVLYQGQVMFEIETRRERIAAKRFLELKGVRYRVDDSTGMPVPLTIHTRNDRLLELMLKAHYPEKYREKFEVKSTNTTGGVLLLGAPMTQEQWLEAAADQQRQYREAK